MSCSTDAPGATSKAVSRVSAATGFSFGATKTFSVAGPAAIPSNRCRRHHRRRALEWPRRPSPRDRRSPRPAHSRPTRPDTVAVPSSNPGPLRSSGRRPDSPPRPLPVAPTTACVSSPGATPVNQTRRPPPPGLVIDKVRPVICRASSIIFSITVPGRRPSFQNTRPKRQCHQPRIVRQEAMAGRTAAHTPRWRNARRRPSM